MRKSSKFIYMRWGDRIFVISYWIILGLFFVVTLYPMIYVVSASVSDPAAVANGKMVLFPVNPTLDAYRYVLSYKEIWIGYANTIFYTVVGTFFNVAATLLCAYALSRKDMPGRNFFMILFMIPMYVGAGLIPAYLNVRSFGLINTRWVLLITGLVGTHNLIVTKSFFTNSIPWELSEAAFLDGCSDFKLFYKVVLPLSAPITVVQTLRYAVGQWNMYFEPMIYLRDRGKYPLQVFLREILTQGQFNASAEDNAFMSAEEILEMTRLADTANMVKYAVIVVATLPMMIAYPFIQKYFEKGTMIGSVKG